MALTNIIPLGMVTHSTTLNGNWAQTNYGTEANVYDGDLNTYIGVRNDANGGGREMGTSYLDSYQTWTTPIIINSLYAKMYTARTAYTGNYANRAGAGQIEIQQTLFIRQSGVWTSVWDYRIVNPSYTDGRPDWYITNTPTVNGPWSNVTGIRAYSFAYGYAYEGQRSNTEWNYLYELSAYSQRYGDIGLRIKKPTVVQNIGVDALDPSHALRIAKNGTTYGIPLLNTSDVNASTTRIEKGGVIYALPKAS